MSKPFDATLKGMLEESPGDWPVLAGFPRGEAEVIDADISTFTVAADKVIRVRGTTDWIMHVEFQAGPDASLPRRLQVGNTLLDDRHGLLVRSVAVLLRPEANLTNLTGVYERRFQGEEAHTVFRYRILRVWQLPVEPLLTGGLGPMPLAPISAVTEADLPRVIDRMKQRLSGRRVRHEAPRLWTATFVLLGMRYSEAAAAQLLEGVTAMEESVTYQAIVRKGRVQGVRGLLLRQGAVQFGRPSKAVRDALEAITDPERLDHLGERLLRAASWEELLDLPPAARKARHRKP
jgi:predicted transposase YdaD